MTDPVIPKRKAPTTLRIPEEWELEIEAARLRQEAKLDKPVTKHAWLLKAIRRILDGERAKAKVINTEAARNVTPFPKGKS